MQTYASGPVSEVNSLIWPNPEFDNDITVHGPQVKALAQRYLKQTVGGLERLPGPDGKGRLLDGIDLVVPHQANKTMVSKMSASVGLAAERLYSSLERVGNTSSASIPLALRDGVIDRRMRIFAPGFGAGAVGCYAVLRLDPAVVALAAQAKGGAAVAPSLVPTASEDVRRHSPIDRHCTSFSDRLGPRAGRSPCPSPCVPGAAASRPAPRAGRRAPGRPV